jgi:hypothetical protein
MYIRIYMLQLVQKIILSNGFVVVICKEGKKSFNEIGSDAIAKILFDIFSNKSCRNIDHLGSKCNY